jgi:hypothetical protein
MWESLCGLIEMVSVLWKADDRPEARRFTLGCAAVILVIVIVVALTFGRAQ